MRYYIANSDNIPLHAQPEKGYTKLQVILRLQREVEEMCNLFGDYSNNYIEQFNEYKSYFHILDSDFNEVHEFDDAI